VNDPALLELFTCLRTAGFPLGLAEYHLLLKAIKRGFGTRDRDALAQLCRALWVKSHREEQIFQDYFDQIIPQRSEPILPPVKQEKFTIADKPVNPKKNKTAQIIQFSLLGVTICVVGIGCVFFLNNLIQLIPKPSNKPELQFSSTSFTADISEKVALVKITRTGSSHGLVSAKLNIGKKCSQNISSDTSQTSDNLIVNDSSQYVQIDGKTGEKTIKISLLKPSKPVFFINSVILCLTDSQDRIISGDQKIATLVIQDKDYWFKNFPYLNYFKPLLITFSCIILLLVTWKTWNIQQLQTTGHESLIPDAETNLSTNVLSPEVIRTIANEIQTTQSTRQDNLLSELFPLIVNDLPVTLRQMKQGWRYLRQFSREGAPTELDLEATIEQVSQQGILLSPVLVPRRTNRIELLLLIDRDGSMVPFHHLAQELADTALRGGRFSRVRVRYFHNCPDEYLYRDPYHLEAEPIDDCLLNLPKARTVCLIFSDAGAARGGLNSRRRRLTKFFLKELGQHVRYTAWLNPVPRQRWETTTAQDIADLVPMFEVNRQEFYRAIDVLRGRYQPLGKVFS
jgi:uncharacterized protein with von Willebrand factor type A (vWA) domain